MARMESLAFAAAAEMTAATIAASAVAVRGGRQDRPLAVETAVTAAGGGLGGGRGVVECGDGDGGRSCQLDRSWRRGPY